LIKATVNFVLSATDRGHFPESNLPEIAFLGRSNVGKSSLLNSLAGKKIAHVSSTPGRTRAINFFAVSTNLKRCEPELMFADLPGYGYAKVSKSISSEWPKFIEPYLKERTQLLICIALIDLNISAQKSDLQLLEFLRHADREFLAVGTKADRLSNNQLRTSLARLTRELEVESILPYSAKTGAGRKELWSAILTALRRGGSSSSSD
jgi:GTP-binding protein